MQTRTCTDSNKCGTTFNKPNETQSCTYTPPATAPSVCTEGSKVCAGSDLMKCLGGQWAKDQTCEFGCSGNACNEKPAEAGPAGNETGPGGGVPVAGFFLLEPSAWPYWILIAIVIILIAWYLLRRRKKKKKQ
jgi:LPXTG-motif cell wall-anchored protein